MLETYIYYLVWWIWLSKNDFSLFIWNLPSTAAPLFPFSSRSVSSTSSGSQSPRIQCRCARNLSYQRSAIVPKISHQLLHLSSPFLRLCKSTIHHGNPSPRMPMVRLDQCSHFLHFKKQISRPFRMQVVLEPSLVWSARTYRVLRVFFKSTAAFSRWSENKYSCAIHLNSGGEVAFTIFCCLLL